MKKTTLVELILVWTVPVFFFGGFFYSAVKDVGTMTKPILVEWHVPYLLLAFLLAIFFTGYRACAVTSKFKNQ